MDRAQLIRAMQAKAPLELAGDWDNVGLLVGESEGELSGPVLLTIDLTDAVMDEAEAMGAGAIIAYHPPIFHPLTRVVCSDAKQRLVHRAIRSGMLIYSPHSALDAATGGLNDWLVSAFGTGDVRALEPFSGTEARRKLVTYLPPESVDAVRHALASAGAGRIGAYELCSFGAVGEGTFLPLEGAKPVIGSTGRFERVEEVRFEMVCPAEAAALAIESIRAFHPYEEPVIDVYDLEPTPHRNAGQGRRIVLDRALTFAQIGECVKAHLGVDRIKMATPFPDGQKLYSHIGVCAGAGHELAPLAVANGCELFLTGEMRHHEVLRYLEQGMAIILAGHTNTERGYLPELADWLRRELTGLDVRVSERDRSPLDWV